jgi:hypothetical protein
MATSTVRPGGRPTRTLVVGLVIVGAALFGYAKLYRQWRMADVSGSWPTTPGTVTASSLTMQQRVGGGSAKTWTVHVAYAYNVAGATHQGTLIHLGGFPSYDSETEARSVLARYPEGATPMVFYEPTNPATAVLEPGAAAAGSSLSLGATLLGLVLLLGGVVVYQSIRRIQAQRDTMAS